MGLWSWTLLNIAAWTVGVKAPYDLRARGTGLGLSVSKRAVESADGRLV